MLNDVHAAVRQLSLDEAAAVDSVTHRREFVLEADGGKTEEDAKFDGRPTCKRRRVWVIRHGEREDEADRVAWYTKLEREGMDRKFDPCLTDAGVRQALAAGDNLRSILASRAATGDAGAAGVDLVYASPLHRTVKTAEQVALALDVPLTTVSGLSECALAMRGRDLTTVKFLTHEELQAANSLVRYKEEVRTSEEFFPTVCRLVQEHPGDGDIVIVSHREAIRSLAGGRVSTPYCVQAEFMVDMKGMSFELVDLHKLPKAMTSRKGGNAGRSKGKGKGKLKTSNAQRKGQVEFKRASGSKRQGCVSS